jgi:hypothetical protein
MYALRQGVRQVAIDPGSHAGQHRDPGDRRISRDPSNRNADDVCLQLVPSRQPGIAPGDPQLLDRHSTRSEKFKLAVDSVSHPFVHRPHQRAATVPVRDASECSPQGRIGSLAAPQYGQRKDSFGTWFNGSHFSIQSLEIGTTKSASASTEEQSCQPLDRGPGSINSGLCRQDTRHDVRVVRYRERRDGTRDYRVKAGRRACHFAYWAR